MTASCGCASSGRSRRAWVEAPARRGPGVRGGHRDARAGGVARSARGLRGAARAESAPGRCTAVLRDQRVIAGIGRSWVDEILWTAMLSPFKRGDDLDERRGRAAAQPRPCRSLGDALAVYEEKVKLPIPDKLPLPLKVHRQQRRAVPALRRDDRGGPLRGLRHVLLPDGADGRARAQGPPAVAAAEVAMLVAGPATAGRRDDVPGRVRDLGVLWGADRGAGRPGPGTTRSRSACR